MTSTSTTRPASQLREKDTMTITPDPYLAPQQKAPPVRPRRRTRLAVAAAVVLAAGGVAAGLALTAAPSWPYPWCGETMTALYDSPRQTFGQFTNELQYLVNTGAPAAQLLADEQALSSDQVSAANGDGFGLGTALAAEQADMTAIGADARQLNQACGKPAGYGISRLAVPAG